MIEDLLPEYYDRFEQNLRYDVLRSIIIDGHEVAWMSYVGTVLVDITGEGKEGELFTGRVMSCECDFTEGIGWNIGEDGQRYTVHGKDAEATCLIRRAALHLRHLELRREYEERFVKGQPNSFSGLRGCIREITLDLIEKGQAGEWLEGSSGASFYGGYFYLQTLAAITGEYMGHLWEDMYPLLEEKLIEIDGAVVKSYTQPPPPKWEEFVRLEVDEWVGIALLPGHRRMAQEWRFKVLDPAGKEACRAPGKRLFHDPVFGPDAEDVDRAKNELGSLIEMCRRQN
jgi:hypothetical protein